MEIKEIEYENFGRCVRISNGIIDCVVTIEFGPRMIRFGFCDDENILYTDPARKYALRNESISAQFGKTAAFYYYGGHRLRISPENLPYAVYPDNSPVVYSILPEGVSFTPPKPKQAQIQLSFEVILADGATDIMLVHSAKNCSKDAKTCGLSPITMLKGGGTAILPQNQQNDPMQPNRSFAFWPETDIKDRRITYGNRYLIIRQEPENKTPLRLGINDIPGWAAYSVGGYAIFKHFLHNLQAVYPDSGSSCEIRLTDDFTELNSLSPIFRIEPEEGIRHVENLSLFRVETPPDFSSEDGIARFAELLK